MRTTGFPFDDRFAWTAGLALDGRFASSARFAFDRRFAQPTRQRLGAVVRDLAAGIAAGLLFGLSTFPARRRATFGARRTHILVALMSLALSGVAPIVALIPFARPALLEIALLLALALALPIPLLLAITLIAALAVVALSIAIVALSIAIVALIPFARPALLEITLLLALALALPIPLLLAIALIAALAIVALRALAIVALEVALAIVALISLALVVVAAIFVGPRLFPRRLLEALLIVADVVVARTLLLRLGLRICGAVERHEPEVVLGMLQQILGQHGVVTGVSISREHDISVVDLICRAADATFRAIAVELLGPEIRVTATAWSIAAAARSTRVQANASLRCVSLKVLNSRRPPASPESSSAASDLDFVA